MASELDQLREHTLVVCDSGDIEAIRKYQPTDATTNPSLILQAATLPQYKNLVDDVRLVKLASRDILQAVAYAKAKQPGVSVKELLPMIIDKLTVNFGVEILKLVPGYCSTEVDARLSFDTEASIAKGRELIKLYEDVGVSKDRVLIKLATTWEGIQAAKVLEAEGIRCNMTLLAIGAAEVNATLISPFVGRILDWFKKSTGTESYPAPEDPGVLSVKEIFTYYKKFGHKTIVMGASFRNKGEILELCGCDRLTIAPKLLEELQTTMAPVTVKLNAADAASSPVEQVELTEAKFRWMLNESPMATEKLSEGIRNFAKDLVKLEQFILEAYAA